MLAMLLLEVGNSHLESILMLHSGKDILTVKAVPRSGNYNRGGIMLSYESNGLLYLRILCNIGVREDDGGCMGDLIVIELTKVLHIHTALGNIGNRGEAVENAIALNPLCCADNIGKLTDARGLDDNSIGSEVTKHLAERSGEITDERATDTTRIHLGDLDSSILKEASVNTDLAKLVLYQNNLFSCVCFLDKLLDERGLSRAEEAGEYIYFRHFITDLRIILFTLFYNFYVILSILFRYFSRKNVDLYHSLEAPAAKNLICRDRYRVRKVETA